MFDAISESEARSQQADHRLLRFGSDLYNQFSGNNKSIALNNARGIA